MRGTKASQTSKPFGLRLLGSAEEEPRILRVRVQVLLTAVLVIANLIGAGAVFVLAVWVIPGIDILDAARDNAVTLVAIPVYIALAIAAGVVWGTRRLVRALGWIREERSPQGDEQRAALQAPLELLKVQALLWLGAVALFTVLGWLYEPRLALRSLLLVSLGGIVTCGHAYLLSELVLRPVAARALAAGPADRVRVPGVTARNLLAWALGAAVPVFGLMVAALVALVDEEVSVAQVAVTALGLGGTTLIVSLLLSLLAARSLADPLRSLRVALDKVERGELDARVVVYDGTEIGQLQDGFNRMVAGLSQREEIRDLFGRYVGEEVARTALEQGIESGGEVRDVAVVFVDIAGSTELAESRRPEEVVELLNRFFSIVIEATGEHGGFVNKFQGDAALVVFGAPNRLDDSCGRALALARALAERLPQRIPELKAGIGVAAGPAVAGNIGDERRHEYTVIGDPVNQAARLADLAKTKPEGVVAAVEAVEGAGGREAGAWVPDGEVELRGRSEPTRLAVPRNSEDPSA